MDLCPGDRRGGVVRSDDHRQHNGLPGRLVATTMVYLLICDRRLMWNNTLGWAKEN